MTQQSQIPARSRWIDVTPPIPALAFRFAAPNDWNLVELPAEQHDFSNPTEYMPLAVCMPSYAACVFSVGARPVYDDGTPDEWLSYLLREQGIEFDGLSDLPIGSIAGVGCEASQDSDAGPMRMRIGLFACDDRLFTLSAMAPAPLWFSVEPHFAQMFATLQLAMPGGHHEEPPTETPQETPASEETTYASCALADDSTALDPEHPINANIRDGGNGLVPNVADVNPTLKCCTVAAGAIRAFFKVPFGWHVIDDGRRTLVFNATGEVQVNLTLIDPEGSSDIDILDAILAEMEATMPNLSHLNLELGGMKCLALRGVRDGDTELEQAFLMRIAADGLMLKTRVTSTPEWMVRGMDVCGLIHEDMQVPGT